MWSTENVLKKEHKIQQNVLFSVYLLVTIVIKLRDESRGFQATQSIKTKDRFYETEKYTQSHSPQRKALGG